MPTNAKKSGSCSDTSIDSALFLETTPVKITMEDIQKLIRTPSYQPIAPKPTFHEGDEIVNNFSPDNDVLIDPKSRRRIKNEFFVETLKRWMVKYKKTPVLEKTQVLVLILKDLNIAGCRFLEPFPQIKNSYRVIKSWPKISACLHRHLERSINASKRSAGLKTAKKALKSPSEDCANEIAPANTATKPSSDLQKPLALNGKTSNNLCMNNSVSAFDLFEGTSSPHGSSESGEGVAAAAFLPSQNYNACFVSPETVPRSLSTGTISVTKGQGEDVPEPVSFDFAFSKEVLVTPPEFSTVSSVEFSGFENDFLMWAYEQGQENGSTSGVNLPPKPTMQPEIIQNESLPMPATFRTMSSYWAEDLIKEDCFTPATNTMLIDQDDAPSIESVGNKVNPKLGAEPFSSPTRSATISSQKTSSTSCSKKAAAMKPPSYNTAVQESHKQRPKASRPVFVPNSQSKKVVPLLPSAMMQSYMARVDSLEERVRKLAEENQLLRQRFDQMERKNKPGKQLNLQMVAGFDNYGTDTRTFEQGSDFNMLPENAGVMFEEI